MCIYTIGYYTTNQKRWKIQFSETWMVLENIILNGVRGKAYTRWSHPSMVYREVKQRDIVTTDCKTNR